MKGEGMDTEDRVEGIAFRPGPLPVGFATRAVPHTATIAIPELDIDDPEVRAAAYVALQRSVDFALGDHEFANEWIKERAYEQAMTHPALAAFYGMQYGLWLVQNEWRAKVRALLEGAGA